jgi:hypothetical protein
MLSTKLKQLIKHTVYAVIPPPYMRGCYSQAGEDAILRFLFDDKKIRHIRYLDIGTNHPSSGNNTYLFYRNGSSGVCVEADKTLIGEIEGSGEAELYIFDCVGISTFDKTEAEKRSASGTYRVTQVVRVPLITINSILRDNFERCPDLLSLDIEGLDLAVLKTIDFGSYPIPVICVETCGYSENHIRPKNGDIATFMGSQGYEVYADTYINTIFVNKAWFYRS